VAPWPIMLRLALLAVEGMILLAAPRFVFAALRDATPGVLRIVGAVELGLVLLILLALRG